MKTARATKGNIFHCIRNVNFAADDDAYGKSIDENDVIIIVSMLTIMIGLVIL